MWPRNNYLQVWVGDEHVGHLTKGWVRHPKHDSLIIFDKLVDLRRVVEDGESVVREHVIETCELAVDERHVELPYAKVTKSGDVARFCDAQHIPVYATRRKDDAWEAHRFRWAAVRLTMIDFEWMFEHTHFELEDHTANVWHTGGIVSDPVVISGHDIAAGSITAAKLAVDKATLSSLAKEMDKKLLETLTGGSGTVSTTVKNEEASTLTAAKLEEMMKKFPPLKPSIFDVTVTPPKLEFEHNPDGVRVKYSVGLSLPRFKTSAKIIPS